MVKNGWTDKVKKLKKENKELKKNNKKFKWKIWCNKWINFTYWKCN